MLFLRSNTTSIAKPLGLSSNRQGKTRAACYFKGHRIPVGSRVAHTTQAQSRHDVVIKRIKRLVGFSDFNVLMVVVYWGY